MSHTPGPWRVDPDLSNIGLGGVTMSNGVEVGISDGESGYLQIADARLIAAGPDLLAALKPAYEILEGLRRSVEWELAPSIMKMIAELTPKRDGAIKKAEGRG